VTDYIKLAHRAMNCRKWHWVDGMTSVEGLVTLDKRLPDFQDLATVDCLYDLVSEAWGCNEDRVLAVLEMGNFWCVIVKNRLPTPHKRGWSFDREAHPRPTDEAEPPFGENKFATEVEALVAALEAAP
jgi:hypothetical protein